MEIHRGFVEDLAIVFAVAAITTVLCRKLRQPVVLGYLLAGFIVGPYIPIPLFADIDRVHTLSELGVVLVMFAIGLEFSFRKLLRLAPTAGIIALIQIALMMWLGYLVGDAFGWTTRESMFTGAMISISSTMIIAKAFSEFRVSKRVADLVLGVLIFEDVVAVLLLAMLTAFSAAEAEANRVLSAAAVQLVWFLVALVLLGFFIVPRSVRLIARLGSQETLLVASTGICFVMALLAERVGYSVALGAFLAGTLISESGHGEQVEHLIQSTKDLFAAIFFISVGMLVDPALLVQYWAPIVVLTVVVVVGKVVSVTIGAFLTGSDVKTSVQAGMSMAQIGEFSFIIASAGLAIGAIREFLYPVAIAVSVITTFITPWLIGNASRAASFVDRHMPQPLETFITLYASWIERLRQPSIVPSKRRRIILLLIADTFFMVAIIAATGLGISGLTEMMSRLTGANQQISKMLVVAAASLLAAPFLFGMVRLAGALGVDLARQALPQVDAGRLDLAEAPRTLMTITLQLGIVFVITLVVFAITQPLLPATFTALLLLAVVIGGGWMFRQRAANLQGHVRAGGEMILQALARQSEDTKNPASNNTVRQLQESLPGLGKLHPVALDSSHISVGKTLSELNLHSLTGASVIAIIRQTEGIVVPSGSVMLKAGDTLALIGTEEAVQSAKEILISGEPPPDQ